jgi:hypothetical protein
MIRHVYLVIPLLSIPVLFMLAKSCLIEIFESKWGTVTSTTYYSLTMAMFITAVTLSLLLDDVGVAYAFIGSSACMVICLLLPPYIGFRYCKEDRGQYLAFLIVGFVLLISAVAANTAKLL